MDAYYFLTADGHQVGPIAGEQLLNYGVTPQTMLWGQNMSNWQPAESVAELAPLFSQQSQQATTAAAANGASSYDTSAGIGQNGDATDSYQSAQQPTNDIGIVGVNDTTVDDESSEERPKHRVWPYVTAIVVLALATIALGLLYLSLDKNNNENASRNSSLQSELNNTKSERDNLQSELNNAIIERDYATQELADYKSTISDAYPIIITDMEIGNTYNDGSIETNYGSSIYDYNTMFLAPKITYTGLCQRSIELKVKLYMPSGAMASGTVSPSGYTYSQTISVSEGDNFTYELKGWGSSNKGNYSSGTYRFEIWYGDRCLKSKQFRVY